MPRPMMNLAGERQPGQQVSPIREQNVAQGSPRSPDAGRDVMPLAGHRAQTNQWTSTFM